MCGFFPESARDKSVEEIRPCVQEMAFNSDLVMHLGLGEILNKPLRSEEETEEMTYKTKFRKRKLRKESGLT